MPGSSPAGPIGTSGVSLTIDEGTMARANSPAPGTVGADASAAERRSAASVAVASAGADPAIEALNLRGAARAAAYALKKAHPSVKFTSGRRNKADQARAMASNVVHNRNWIEDTYAPSTVSKACQKWVDGHPDAKTQEEIAAGLLSVLDVATDAHLARLSRHLSGDAFDVQPVESDAEAIKKTIRGLKGLDVFLEKEGGLIRWHAQF
jgi:hypothetical protein